MTKVSVKSSASRVTVTMWRLPTSFWFGFVQVLMVQSKLSPDHQQQQPSWIPNNEKIGQHQHHIVITDAIHLITKVQDSFKNQQSRMLQNQNCSTTDGSDNQCVLQTPEEICEQYNNATAGILTCTCSRYGTSNTQVDCTYDAPQCNSDNSTCFTGSISQIYNTAFQARAVTTCTSFIKSFVETVPLNTELCVRVLPLEDGNFFSLASCSATLQQSGSGVDDDGTQCSSCTLCETPNDGSTNTMVNPNISFDCCNVMTDIRQTCVPVTATNGIAVPQYDSITPENKGTCTSHAYSYRTTGTGSTRARTSFRLLRMLDFSGSTTGLVWLSVVGVFNLLQL